MNKQLKTFLLSWLMPGLGYLHNGYKKLFYTTIVTFFIIIILVITLRVIISFWGFAFLFIFLPAIYLFTAIHATFKMKGENTITDSKTGRNFFLTIVFLLLSGLSIANRRSLMGFDIMSMEVPVMQPSVLQFDRFIIDTWAYNNDLPMKGDIVAHTFEGQNGIYLNRIIGASNDTIEIKNNVVLLNGGIFSEPYVLSGNNIKPTSKNMNALVVPDEHYFVMGDNRDASLGDSRFSGTISIGNIIGKATDIISSKDKSRVGKMIK
jgi:signal peptidase I